MITHRLHNYETYHLLTFRLFFFLIMNNRDKKRNVKREDEGVGSIPQTISYVF